MSHPYISGAGNISSMIDQLRKSLPATVDSNTLKKLGLAPKNESYVINCLQFIRVIDEEGHKTEDGGKALSQHKDEDFQESFSKLVKASYSEIFDLHGEAAWTLPKADLITFFRNSDQTSAAIGARQASVFQVLANKSGKLEDDLAPKSAAPSNKATATKTSTTKKPKSDSKASDVAEQSKESVEKNDFGLSVKVEINLPSDATAETYDNIFKSIKKNLLNG